MQIHLNPRQNLSLAMYVLKWTLLCVPIAALVGSACALFLWALDVATQTRWDNPWLLYLLPLAGVCIVLMYQWLGKSVEGGNNLIMDQIHAPGGGVPARMAPLILVSTVVTHLFGGSAGREGTAVQMGGSIASWFSRKLRLTPADTRIVLMTGIAAGFGGVFGTPVAGAIFALEVLAIGRITHEAIVPCLLASIVGDWSCEAWGAQHTDYHQVIQTLPTADGVLLAKVALAAVAFGLTSLLFAEMTHGLQRLFRWAIPWPLLRPVTGALIVIGLVYVLGTRDYLGLGVHTPPGETGVSILSSFTPGGADPFSWWWKIVFTAVTLSCGFKGGEVTPLFFIGAALGNTLGWLMDAPVDLFAGLGFVAVFAGATNTPIACTIMGIELFGAQHALYIAAACSLAYLFSGHSGIYLSQRIAIPKIDGGGILPDSSLRECRESATLLGEWLRWPFTRQPLSAEDIDIEGDPSDMGEQHQLVAKEIGQLRIYMTHSDKRSGALRDRFFGRPLYREIVDAAKTAGLPSATAHATHYGYTSHGRIQKPTAEGINPSLNICVELIARRELLEQFCQTYAELLEDKVMVYKHLEHWDLQATTLVVHDADTDELAVDSGPLVDDESTENR